eukprot:6291584-Amphidinium_carterae.1
MLFEFGERSIMAIPWAVDNGVLRRHCREKPAPQMIDMSSFCQLPMLCTFQLPLCSTQQKSKGLTLSTNLSRIATNFMCLALGACAVFVTHTDVKECPRVVLSSGAVVQLLDLNHCLLVSGLVT